MITCQWENGEAVRLRHVVVDAIVLDGDKVLLAHRSPTLLHRPDKWCLPGGYVDRDETVSQAVVREVREETGYDSRVRELFLIDTEPRSNTDRQNIGFFFLVEPLAQVGKPDWETQDVRWFPLNSLPPEQDMAFTTHIKTLNLLKQHRLQPTPLPIMHL